jgi:hypothetical protein
MPLLVTAPKLNLSERHMRMAEEYADTLVDAVRPQHFMTLTFAFPTSSKSAMKHFDAWMRGHQKRAGRSIPYAVVSDSSGVNGRMHLHALVGKVGRGAGVSSSELATSWKHGICDAQPFDPLLRGAFYVAAKVVAAQLDDGAEFDVRAA